MDIGNPEFPPDDVQALEIIAGVEVKSADFPRAVSVGRNNDPSTRMPKRYLPPETSMEILVAGFILTKTGEAIAETTGLGQSFFGAVFLAIATSLPELSSVVSALRHGHEMLAISDVLGGSLFDLALVFVVDTIYAGGPVLNEVGTFSAFAALLGIALTTFYVIGMIERRDRRIFRMGYDSVAVLVCYAIGLAVLYGLR